MQTISSNTKIVFRTVRLSNPYHCSLQSVFFEKFSKISETWQQNLIILSDGFKVHRLETIMWLVSVSVTELFRKHC